MESGRRQLLDKLLMARVMGRKGSPLLQEILSIPEISMQRVLEQGYQLFDNEEFVKAKRLFDRLVRLNPLVEEYWMALGINEMRMGNWEKALMALSRAGLLSQDASPYYYIGLCLMQLNREPNGAFQMAAMGDGPLSEKALDWLELLA